jgi:hypothetical protein
VDRLQLVRLGVDCLAGRLRLRRGSLGVEG